MKRAILTLSVLIAPALAPAQHPLLSVVRDRVELNRDEERALMRDRGFLGGPRYCGGLELSAAGYDEARRLLRKEGYEGPDSNPSVCAWLSVPGREHLLFLVAVRGWRAIEKNDERFAADLLKPGESVRGPEHDYVSPEVYAKVQREKSRQYADFLERLKENLSKS